VTALASGATTQFILNKVEKFEKTGGELSKMKAFVRESPPFHL
jgi:hypothetical protein